MIALFIAWRLLRHVRKLLLLLVVIASVMALSHGWLNRVGDPSFWRSQAHQLQRKVQQSVERGLRPPPSAHR